MSGVLVGSHLYLNQIPSLSSDLLGLKLHLLSGRALSQLYAPFSEAKSIAYLSASFWEFMRSDFF